MDVATRKPASADMGRAIPAGLPASRARAIKDCLEFLLALLILVGTAPILILALALVRLTSRGPGIYTQKRLGLGGRCFTIYKIRTMYDDSEPAGPRWSLPGDPRVTPVGRLLRWSHVDELPQLINVLQGAMSLIGPRPERPEIVDELERVLPHLPPAARGPPRLERPGPGPPAPGCGPRHGPSQAGARPPLPRELEPLARLSGRPGHPAPRAERAPAIIARLLAFPWEAMASDDIAATSPVAAGFQSAPTFSNPAAPPAETPSRDANGHEPFPLAVPMAQPRSEASWRRLHRAGRSNSGDESSMRRVNIVFLVVLIVIATVACGDVYLSTG